MKLPLGWKINEIFCVKIDDTAVIDKQSYIVDKDAKDDNKIETSNNSDAEDTGDGLSEEGNIGEEKLENLKESLNKEDENQLNNNWIFYYHCTSQNNYACMVLIVSNVCHIITWNLKIK